MELSIVDTRHLHAGIQQLYTLHDFNNFGANALTIVDRLVPGDIPEFHLTNLRTRQISSTFLPDFLGYTPAMEQVKFTERDRLVLSLFRPHLSQAYNNAHHYHQLQQECDRVQHSLNHLALLGLSQRETEVLKLVIQGENNKAIASQLNIHSTTVRKHLENIYAKWEVKSRTEAIAKALREIGLL
jgi:DNA-binding NarL/FixJ family response regulator